MDRIVGSDDRPHRRMGIALDQMPEPRAETDGGRTLFVALQAQAGLQLTSRKLPSPVLVVDSMEKTPVVQ